MRTRKSSSGGLSPASDRRLSGGRSPQSSGRGLSGGRSPQSKPLLALIAVLALAIGGTAYFVGSPAPAPASADALAGGAVGGKPAPEFSATATDGSTVTLDKPTWLVFQASWCADCRTEAPDIQAAWKKAEGSGVQIVGVYTGEDTKAVTDYAGRLGMTFRHVPDPESALSARFGVRGVPTHVFVDGRGQIAKVRVGVLTPAEMDAELAALKG